MMNLDINHSQPTRKYGQSEWISLSTPVHVSVKSIKTVYDAKSFQNQLATIVVSASGEFGTFMKEVDESLRKLVNKLNPDYQYRGCVYQDKIYFKTPISREIKDKTIFRMKPETITLQNLQDELPRGSTISFSISITSIKVLRGSTVYPQVNFNTFKRLDKPNSVVMNF